MTEFSFIDLFAGIGGLRIGFDKMGGKCVFASEIDKFARQTYEENFDLVMGQDYVILQLERWIEDNKKIISHWDNNEESLKKH